MIGKRIGQYEILEQLGKGGMATVYRAYHPAMERFVAVKIIHQALAQDQAGVERFRQEARLIARLEHPHLLPVYDYAPDSDPPYIVMRYLEGGTLKEVIESKYLLPLSEVAYLMRQIASALDYAHRNGVIHRDIKPSNIMVDADGNAYVADFGIARIMGEAGVTQTGFAVGTPGYMSPEQGMGVATITAQTDIYALGVMIFEMATGQSPYSAETPMAVLMKHIQAPVPSAVAINPKLPEEMDEIIAKAMAKEPAERYQTAGELAAALSRLVSSNDMNRAPENIRTIAVKAIKEIKENRNEEEIDRLLQEFKGTRSEGMKAVSLEDEPTTVEKAVQQNSNMPLVAGMVVGLFIIIAIAAFLFIQNSNNNNATETANANAVIAANETATAENLIFRNTTATIALVVASQATEEDETSETATRGASATNTERPTNTPSPTDTATATDTLTPTLTPTPSVPVLRTLRQLDARIGPANDFAVILTLGSGEELEITGISADSRWYQVLLPIGSFGWIPRSQTFVQVFGPQELITVAEAPQRTATPTPTANRTGTTIAITSTAEAEETLARQTANAQASNAQATNNAVATENAVATTNAQSTIDAINAVNSVATTNAQGTADARGTVDALLTGTAVIQSTNEAAANARATENALLPTATPLLVAVAASSPGRLPFVMDFESGTDALVGSDYVTDKWQVVTEGGQTVLIANARLNEPFVILGSPESGVPEWLESTSADFVVSFRINMTAVEGGRLVFRYQEGLGYNALEITPGRIYLRRSRAGANPLTDRDSEIFLGSGRGYSVPISTEEWSEITVWVEGARIYVYVGNDLIANVEDLNTPQLGAGQILLQTNNAFRPVRFDDIVIQRAEPGSDHFQAGTFPRTWERSDSVAVNLGTESDGNAFIEIGRNAFANPIMPPTRDLELACRVYSVEGGYTLYLRETEAGGALRLTLEAGEMLVEIVDGTGAAIFSQRVPNFYTRLLWQDLHIYYVEQRLEISLDGELEFEETLDIQLTGGNVRFASDNNDIVRIDDCLLTQSAATGDEGAAFAFEILQEVNARDFRYLRSDLDEIFSDEFRTDVWWVDGLNAAGDYLVDSGSSEHQNFLRMTYLGLPTFRLFRDNVGVEIFGAGADRRTFRDSTDVMVTVDVNLPLDNPSEAWLGIRSTSTITGTNINGYRATLRRNRDNSVTLFVDYRSATGVQSYYEGEVPNDGTLPDWINLTVVALDDKIAFFANNRFVVFVDNAEALGGTLALGVGENSTANFDTLIIRDTSPHGE